MHTLTTSTGTFSSTLPDSSVKAFLESATGRRCSAMIGDAAAAESYFLRALRVAPANEPATYGLALLAYKAGRFDDARRWMKAIRPTNLPPEALYLGLCVERKLGDRQAEASYTAQLRNRYPDAAETKALATGVCE